MESYSYHNLLPLLLRLIRCFMYVLTKHWKDLIENEIFNSYWLQNTSSCIRQLVNLQTNVDVAT